MCVIRGQHDFWRVHCLFLAREVTLLQRPQINNTARQILGYYHYHQYTTQGLIIMRGTINLVKDAVYSLAFQW